MKWFTNMKIMTKLISAFLLVSILGIIVGIVSVNNMLKMDKSDTALYEENVLGISAIASTEENFLKARLAFRAILMRTNAEEKSKDLSEAKGYLDATFKAMDAYEKTITTEEDRNIFTQLKASFIEYNSIYLEVETALSKKASNSEIILLFNEHSNIGATVENLFTKLLVFNEEQAKGRSDSNTKQANTTIALMITLISLSTLLSLALGIYISIAISKPVNKLAEVGKKLALGDVNVEINIDSKDEVGMLAEAFRSLVHSTKEQAEVIQKIADGDMTVSIKVRSEADIMNRKLEQMLIVNNGVFGEIKKAADQVNSAANQVAQGSTMLAQASTEQASTVEEINSTVGSIASQSKENANSARNANELADEARLSAEIGASQMKNMMTSMEGINEASRNISKIIRVIDDIAFQTNILALNAAVEAARAGSHGKGFAVVAEEVRNLAARSAKAANETTDLIESTIAKVNAGTKIASETSQALNLINDKIGKVTGMIAEIASSSGEQASAVAQVSLGMGQIAEAVSTNSATAEESAAASEELSAQSTLLKESVSRFKLKNGSSNYEEHEISEKNNHDSHHNQSDYNSFGKY